MAFLRSAGKIPVVKEVLIMSVIKGSSWGMHFSKMVAGIGSSSHDFRDISFIIFSISV